MGHVAPEPESPWPPRSPRDALLSTPGGRERYRRMLNRTSPSPSPSKKSRTATHFATSAGPVDDPMHTNEEEDEETLELKLQEIQARLKLKRLQSAKGKEPSERSANHSGAARSQSALSVQQRQRAARGTTPGADERPKSVAHTIIQVPASPVRSQALPPQTSPSRVLLGIDKGLKAKDVSLKRAPSHRQPGGNSEAASNGGYLRRSRTPNPSTASLESSRPLSFNERLASVRTEEASRAERQDRIKRIRTNAFGIGEAEMEQYKKNAVELPDEPLAAPSFTREEVLSSQTKPSSGGLRRSNTLPNVRSTQGGQNPSLGHQPNQSASGSDPEVAASSFEPYSCLHLSKRILPHRVVARHVSGKKVLNVKDLLRDVKAPDFALPDIEQDIVVFAVVGKKSDPRAHKPAVAKNGLKAEERGKFMIITLVDLDYELDMFLFNSGFERFWKLTEGTVVAILNPTIMPPPPGRQDTGRFSLVINSDADTIIEIGSARDMGFCQSMKKDGDLCSAWVNKKKTEFCEYHSNEALRKQKGARIEMNTNGFGPGQRKKTNTREVLFEKKTSNYDWETRSQWFSSRSMSAADLIDGKDRGAADRKEKAEFLKRGLQAKEREHDMMKKLGQVGNAAGREYMRQAGSRTTGDLGSGTSEARGSNVGDPGMPDKPDAKSLGLLSKDHAIHLSPIKRKRADSSQTGSMASVGNKAAFGWGTNLTNKLSRMKEGEKLRKDEEAPVRKKTRFVTAKGIREAGRESLGIDFADRKVELEGDDDDLIIVQ